MTESYPSAAQLVGERSSERRRRVHPRCAPSWVAALALLGLALGLPAARAAEAPGTQAGVGDELGRLVDALGAADYADRVEAMRRLAARGAEATAALREAAQRPDPEVALRARQLMRVLDQLLFQGVEVHLEAEPAEVAWDEPVSVRVTFRQRGLSAGRVPFALDPTDRAALTPTARQVGDLLDLAEWLQIEGPTGAPVPLRVDDLDDSEAAEAAVGQRLVAGPMSELAPGQTASVVVEAVNRGWARLPMLDPGRYTLQLRYEPAWDDDVLVDRQVGWVISNPVAIEVTDGAPDEVSRHGITARVELVREADELSARLVNRWDLPVYVNRNFGPGAPFAEGRWEYHSGATRIPLVELGGERRTWAGFSRALIDELPPGSSVEVARIAVADLRAALQAHGLGSTVDEPVIEFAYTNVCTRGWQVQKQRELQDNPHAPADLQTPLPPRMVTVHYESDPVALSAPADPAEARDQPTPEPAGSDGDDGEPTAGQVR